jgi:phospholipid/cholesterol/gamma-HCH transport system permease protein
VTVAVADAPFAPYRELPPREQKPAPPLPPTAPAIVRGTSVVWELLVFAGATFRAILTPPYVWKREFVEQSWLLFKRGLIPCAVSAAGFGYGAPGLQGTSITDTFGDINRVAAIVGAATIREQAMWVTGMVVAGVVGTAICADLGARKIRDELDAMEVIGVDSIKRLVAPRVMAITLLMPALGLVVIVTEFYAIMLAYLYYGGTAGEFAEAGAYSFAAVDIFLFFLKTVVVGAIVGVVCCFKGVNASGGSLGVGRAVNQAVVLAFVLVWTLNFAFNSTYLSLFPEAQTLR